MKIYTVTSFFWFVCACAQANPLSLAQSRGPSTASVRQIVEVCYRNDLPSRSLCAGFVNGIITAMIFNCDSVRDGYSPADYLSSSRPTSINAAIANFLDWADNNPNDQDSLAFVGIAAATSLRWPCD